MLDRELLISIHDVMPSTLRQTEAILKHLEKNGQLPATLLVVPNKNWQPTDIALIRKWHDQGWVALAGHGWNHHVANIKGLRHWMHSKLISKQVAEHLAESSDGCVQLINRCQNWFEQQRLPRPTLYVPPAWALGRLSAAQLYALPFSYLETLAGIYDLQNKRFVRSPMVGFEATNAFQAIGCRLWNWLNLRRTRHQPLRIAIHPNDLQLRLAKDLEHLLDQGGKAINYDHAFGGKPSI